MGSAEEQNLPDKAVVVKSPIQATGKILSIVPQNVDEAYRLAEGFVLAGMAPRSYVVESDHKSTIARVMIGIMHGMAVGYAPTIALANIMIINNKACLYGDGASALLNRSGVVENIKTEVSGGEKGWGPGYKVTVSLKRKDQSEPFVRSFSYEDAKRAGLLNKRGPWIDYPERQCYWRAWSWAARDGASDALLGLHIAEEVNDYKIEQARKPVDTSDLDKGLPKHAEETGAKRFIETRIHEDDEVGNIKITEELVGKPTWTKKKFGLMAYDLLSSLKKVNSEDGIEIFMKENDTTISNVREHGDPEVVEALDFGIQNKRIALGKKEMS